MKILKEHIAQLYLFTNKHYVIYYDVQTELVDHLANNIEQIWEENPNVSFEEARDISFKKFGVFGFMDVLESKQRQLNKKYIGILWKHMKAWFTLPKVMLTFSIFLIFYFLISLQIDEMYFTTIILLLTIIDMVLATRLANKAKKRFKIKQKKYLLEDIIFKVGAFSSIFVFSNLFHVLSFLKSSNSIYFKVFVAALITLTIMYSYISLLVLPKKIETILKETYLEYNFAN